MVNVNKPTTGEIVRAIRLCEEGEINCTKCPFANKSCGDLNLLAADRLESQEREIEQLKKANQFGGEMIDKQDKNIARYKAAIGEQCAICRTCCAENQIQIASLTDRAEQAERKNAELIGKIIKLEGGTWT